MRLVRKSLNDIAVKSERPESALKTFMAALTHYYKTVNAPINSELLANFFKALTKPKKKTSRQDKNYADSKMSGHVESSNNDNLGLERLRQKATTIFALSAM